MIGSRPSQTTRCPSARRWAARILAGLAGLGVSLAAAQDVNCVALANQLSALARQPASPQAASYAQAAQKQQIELARTVSYAQSLGCNRQQFLFFGDPPPPQCSALNQRIAAMQANLGQLRSAAQAGGLDQRRRMLTAQYEAYCSNRPSAQQGGSFFDQLFGGGRVQELPNDPEMPLDPEEDRPRGGPVAVCVRTCDGGFFPVSYSATRRSLDDLADLCSALCPNADTMLFTKRQDAEIDTALSADGVSYASLANAGKFKKKFDPSCACKPANKSWSEALADAERMIANKSNRDIIVTPQRAEELSRPKVSPAAALTPAAKPTAKPDARPAVAARTVQEAEEDKTVADLEREGKVEAEAASRSNAGITPGRHAAGRLYTVRDGQRETVTTPDGTTRTVRVVGPRS